MYICLKHYYQEPTKGKRTYLKRGKMDNLTNRNEAKIKILENNNHATNLPFFYFGKS